MPPTADDNLSGSLRCMASIEKEYAQASKTGEQRGTVLSSRKAE